MKIEYLKVYGDYGSYTYKKVKFTGRWKLVSGPYYTNKMFLEVKGLLFKHWYSEDYFEVVEEWSETIFECYKNLTKK